LTNAAGHYLTQPLHRALRESPDELASVDGSRKKTWREVGERVSRFAAMLGRFGLVPGDRVAMLARNGDHYLDYLFGTFWAGGVVNPVNLRWSDGEIAYSLADCSTRILIVDHDHLARVAAIRQAAPCIETVIAIGGGEGCFDYDAELASSHPTADVVRSGDDLAAILYTGGTTGKPKGVMLSHRSMMASALGYAGAQDCGPGTSMMHTAPLFHVGAISGVIASMLRRSVHVFVPGFDPQSVMQAIEINRVSDIFLVPTMIQALLDHPEYPSRDLSSVERIIYGAAPMPSTLQDRVMRALPGCGFVQAYGMTELSPVATLLSPEDHRYQTAGSQRARSAGRATMTVEVRIVDASGVEVPVGDTGEIAVRGESVMAGYWGRPEDTDHALRDGWMHTGDIGRMDQDGFVYVVDRLKDMIVSGGENIYSVEVEGALASHPAVAMCAVIGRTDPHWGESVHAVVVIRPGFEASEDTLRDHCRAQIAAYKCPRSFEFRDSLPLTAAGKILKSDLRKELVPCRAR
jgi:acyl-CoA synthetase (AMP-forming)/AMP-acid ligase II